MKKKSFSKKYAKTKKMDEDLISQDLSDTFAKRGKLHRPSMKKINLDLPAPILQKIDLIAETIGVARQPLLKLWIHERLQSETQSSVV